MTFVDYLHILRRRWKLIGLAAVLVAALAFLTAPKPPSFAPGVSSTGYQATATLLQDPSATTDVNLPLVELYIKTGAIPEAAAKTLHYPGNIEALANVVLVNADPKTSTITITVTDPSAAQATAIANAFADATVNYLQQNQQQSNQKSIATLQTSLAKLNTQIEALNAQIAASSNGATPSQGTVVAAQRDALLLQYQALYQRLTQLQTQPAEASQLDVLQRAVAVPIVTPTSTFTAPKSRNTRTVLGALIGLLLGAAGALLLESFDTRLRTRGAIERAFRVPVVAEIPKASRRTRRRYTLAAMREPDGSLAEAFRTLRSALTLMPSLPLTLVDEVGLPGQPTRESPAGPPSVIVVTAADAGVGKTTTAANLAACLAEAGRSVLLLDCDFRHPEAHKFFGVDNRFGLSDVLAAGEAVDLRTIAQYTTVPGVSLVPAGTASWIPTRLVQHVETIVTQARAFGVVTVIDSPPLLGASEAADLAAQADSVIVIAWAGRTTAEHAERTFELLARVGAPVLGVALVSTSGPIAYASGMAGQRSWPMNRVDRRGGRPAPRERSRPAGHRNTKTVGT